MIRQALGIGRPAERQLPARAHERQVFRSAQLKPWGSRFRFGWILSWDGLYWHDAIGIKGSDFDNGDWLGGQSWRHGFGPIAICRNRRRGSLVSDIHFERVMGCSCQHLVWLWFKGNGQIKHRFFCAREEGTDQ